MVYKLLPLVAILLLIGCTSDVADEPNWPETAPPLEVATQTNEIPEATAVPSSTYVPASVTPAIQTTNGPLATSTPVPTATLTPAPTATLTDEEIAANLAELMETNGGCELPCWWGMVPGSTHIETAKEKLTTLGLWWSNNYAGIRVKDDFGVFLEFAVDERDIDSIIVGGDYLTGDEDSPVFSQAFACGWQRYGPAEVLNRYGLPSQVLVYSPFRADPGGGPSYHLLMFYDDLGFEIEYRGSAEQLNSNRYRACPDLADIWTIGLFLYQPGQVDNVMERVLPSDSIDYIAGPETVYDLISWEGATGTDLQTFYEKFIAPEGDVCFEYLTPWP